MMLTVVFVHYRTEGLLNQAVDAVLGSNWPKGGHPEIIVVDNSASLERDPLALDAPHKVVTPERNLGYAGGINLGVAQSSGAVICVVNPDVLVEPDCLPLLMDTARRHNAIVGPRFHLDDGGALLLPCTEKRGRWEEWLRVIGSRHPLLLGVARRSWRCHARRHWLADQPLQSVSLSGALLMFERKVWDRGEWPAANPVARRRRGQVFAMD